MKSLSTYLEEKHNPKEDVVKDLRVIVLTTNMSETSKESTDKTLFRTAKRIKEECEKKNIPFYALYCESGYISKDDDDKNLMRRKLNSSFDESVTYVPRSDRKEWDTVGLMGKLRMTKGQKTGTNWIKMKDISDTVEEWLVR